MLYTWVYNNFIKYAGIKIYGRVFRYFHKILLAINDPVIECEIREKKCRVPFSHMTPYNMKLYCNYDMPLKKICEYTKEKLDCVINIIDVGANIGDSVLNIGIHNAKYLLVEGVEKYAELIQDNLREDYDYVLENAFLADKSCGGGVSVEVKAGTASIHKDYENINNKIDFMTLDEVVLKYHFEPHIIKIDTDGFDFKILRGTEQTLKKYSPIIFFEWNIQELIKNEEDPIAIFSMLREIGYLAGFIFDNFGNLLTRVGTNDETALKLLAEYTMTVEPTTICYYDILLIHKNSTIIAEKFIKTL